MPGEPPTRGPTGRHTVGGVDTAVLERDGPTLRDLLAELDQPERGLVDTIAKNTAAEAMRAIAAADNDTVAARYGAELLAESAGVLRWLAARGWLHTAERDVDELAATLLRESEALTTRGSHGCP